MRDRDEKLLNALGLHSLNEETLIFLKYALGEIGGNEGAAMLGITLNSFRVRACRIRHRKDTLRPIEKKTGPKTRYKVEGCEELIKSYRKKGLSEGEISYIRKETTGADISPATVGRFLKEEGFDRMQRRTRKEKGKKRRYDINFMLEDAGLALFTGSSTVLCSTSLHSFDYDMKEATLREMKTIYIEILKKYMDLSVLHVDFHTTPYFGDSAEMEINHIATRGKNMKGALIFLVQDRESRMFPYSNANVRRSEASGEIKKFLDMVEPLGIKPEWIIIDSKVTN